MKQPYPYVGQTQPFPPPPLPVRPDETSTFLQFSPLYTALSAAGTALGAYHGYKRHSSVSWAIGWAVLGGFAPFIVIPVAFAQGFGTRGPK